MNATTLPPNIRVFERGWLSSNNVLFIGPDDNALVDSGYVTHREQTLALVRHALAGAPLDRLVNTHLHSDHCGGNAFLQTAYPGLRTTIPAAEADAVSVWDEDVLSYRATGQQCDRFVFERVLQPGESIELGGVRWDALGAPGHDPNSLILYAPALRVLISADALWENGFGVIFPELVGESGFAEQRAVLAEIARLDVGLVVPGHGSPFADVRGALARAASRLDYLESDPKRNAWHALKVLVSFALMERRRLDVEEVAAMIDDAAYFREMSRRFFDQPSLELATSAAQALVRAGAARFEGGVLLPANQPAAGDVQ